MHFVLHIWRQKDSTSAGHFVRYEINNISADSSFLEMLDVLNEQLVEKGDAPVAFEHDCREGVCGSCAMVINGEPHGPQRLSTTCQVYMRSFTDGQEIYIEPWRARAFPVVKDLVADRSSLDRIQQAGGFISVNTGAPRDANSILIGKEVIDLAHDAAVCIQCGACVAACPNGSAALFTAAKVSHLALLAQGQPERYDRVLKMVDQMDAEIFGSCTNHGECQDACPKGISIKYINFMNRDYLTAQLKRATGIKGKMQAQ